MSTTEASPLLQPMQSNEMRSPNFLPHLPQSFDPQGLLEFQTKMVEMQRRITASSATASANSYIPNPPTNQEYLASLRFLVNTAGPYVVGTLDEKGFTVMHYVAGMIHDHGQVLELVEYVLKVWEIFHQGNTTEIENWSATSLIPHPLMEIEGKPVFEGSLFRDAAKSTAEEELYQKRLLSMKGYFPLAVATRAGNTKAIEVLGGFLTEYFAYS
ncbi:hypothetical protein BDR26DRAFT_197368 [Obelidium mucronatum]|nr:hypothetical protein BDR26DRAFT_197368 [Obelidium mucronatum]